MDVALRKSDTSEPKELVFAWMFTDVPPEVVNPYDFCCPYPCCHVDQKLVSHQQKEKRARKERNNDKTGDKAGYFKKVNEDHHIDCPEHKNNKRKVKDTNGLDPRLPLEHVSKLILRKEGQGNLQRGTKVSSSSAEQKHHHQAYHLSNPVNWFLQNPTEGFKEINIEGCSYSQYRDVFQKLSTDPKRRYAGKHVYFGSLERRGPDNFEIVDGEAIFYIYQYDKDKKVIPIKVRLQCNKFSESKLKIVRQSFDHATQRLKELLKKKGKSKKKKMPFPQTWVFFYGEPTELGAREFIVERHDCVYFYTSETLDLPTRPHFYNEPQPQVHSQPLIEKEDRLVAEKSKPRTRPAAIPATKTQPQQTGTSKRSVPQKEGMLARIKRAIISIAGRS